MIECKHKLLEIDYNNINMNEIIKFKLSALDILNSIKRWNTQVAYDNYSELDNFGIITNAAFGLMNNPYGNVIRDFLEMKRQLEKTLERLSEYWILQNIEFLNNEQTFNPELLFQYNRKYTKEESIQSWIKIVENFDKSIKLYNEALKIRDTKILKKYLGFPSTKKKVNGFWYTYKSNSQYGTCNKILYSERNILVESYHFGDNWHIYTSKNTIKFSEDDTEYAHIWEEECPECYI